MPMIALTEIDERGASQGTLFLRADRITTASALTPPGRPGPAGSRVRLQAFGDPYGQDYLVAEAPEQVAAMIGQAARAHGTDR